MNIKVISYGKHKDTAQIVINGNGKSTTLHVRKLNNVWLDAKARQYELPKEKL